MPKVLREYWWNIAFGYYVIDWGFSGPAEYFIIAFGTFFIFGNLSNSQ